MKTPQKQQIDLELKMSEFEEQNPKIAHALKLFGVSMATYQGALNALDQPRVSQSASTIAKDKQIRG